jgi:hypothetical protein
VAYVAISAAAPDGAAAAQAGIIRGGQPWLVPVWHHMFWKLYRVTGAAAEPRVLLGPAGTRAGVRIGGQRIKFMLQPSRSPSLISTPFMTAVTGGTGAYQDVGGQLTLLRTLPNGNDVETRRLIFFETG